MDGMKSTGWAVASCVESGAGRFRRIPFLGNPGWNGAAAAADGMSCCGMLGGDALGIGLPTGRFGAAAVVYSMAPQPFASIIGNDDGK